MAAEILIQKTGEHYSFTRSGEMMAYFHTAKRILYHYMLKKQVLDEKTIQQKLGGLQAFLSENFHQRDDYLNKLDLIANYIGEADFSTLSSFFGKQFLVILNQTKQQLFNQEIPKYRKRFENPLRTPSYDLMDYLGPELSRSPNLPPALSPSKEVKRLLFEEEEEASLSNEKPFSSEKQTFVNGGQGVSEKMLGALLLKSYKEAFMRAEPLSLPLKSELLGKNEDYQKEMKTFEGVVQQISFKEYAQLANKQSKFIKNKDDQGYQSWLSELEPRLRACVIISQLLSKEQNAQEINWERQMSSMSDHLYLELDKIKKIKHESGIYREVLSSLHDLLQKLPGETSGLYPQLILLFDKRDNIDSKRSALKIMLLQITAPASREKLFTEIVKLLDRLG